MLYVGFDTTGKVLKITNEPDNILQYLKISSEMFNKFAESIENIDDYIVVKKDDYVLEKKDNKEYITANIFTVPRTDHTHKNSIYVIQNKTLKNFSITHTFDEDKLPPPQTYKKFFVTHLNNANKLFCTLECKYEDFFAKPLTFDTKYYDDCRIITQPDIQSYYHFIGETIE
tara:strand:- start:1163 stop:1678 length:516 start_codon:yes stop_codon:yes gene_type:complete